jgi:chemotaxis protein CheC
MSNNTQLFTEEQMDFIREMMNIGAGNAATALQQLLQCPVDVIIPRVHILPVAQVTSILDNPIEPVACVRMGMVGDIGGAMFFIVPEESSEKLVKIAEKAQMGTRILPGQKHGEEDFSAIVEIGNILSGVYLAAVHDFCGLNINHTVPVLAVDMIQPLLDEALIKTSIQMHTSVLVENEFMIGGPPVEPVILIEHDIVLEKQSIKTFMLMIPSAESIKPLIDALGQAKKAYGAA